MCTINFCSHSCCVFLLFYFISSSIAHNKQYYYFHLLSCSCCCCTRSHHLLMHWLWLCHLVNSHHHHQHHRWCCLRVCSLSMCRTEKSWDGWRWQTSERMRWRNLSFLSVGNCASVRIWWRKKVRKEVDGVFLRFYWCPNFLRDSLPTLNGTRIRISPRKPFVQTHQKNKHTPSTFSPPPKWLFSAIIISSHVF